MSPSPRRSTIAGVLSHYRVSIPREASRALEERDDAWRTQNHALSEERTMQEDELEWLRRRNRALEEERVQLERSIDVLEKERGDLEHEFGRLETKRGEEVDRVSELLRRNRELENEVNGLRRVSVKAEKEDEVIAVKGMEERACQLVERNYVLEKEIGEMRAESERILNEKARKEAELKAMCELVDKIMGLEEEKRRAIEEENSKLAHRIKVLEGEKAGMEARVEKARIDESREYDRLEAQKVRAEEAEKRVSGYLKTIRGLEAKGVKADREKSKEIERILNEKKRLVEVKNDRISELARKAWVLEREKAEMDAEVVKANKDKSDVSARLVEVEKALEREKEASEAKVLEEEKRRAMECQLNEENLKLADRIEALERDRGAMEAEVSKKEIERNCVTLRMQNVKKDLEDEKRRLEDKVSELAKRIVVLEGEKAGMEAEVEKARIDKSHEFDRVVEVNKALGAQKVRAEEAEMWVSDHLKTIRALETKVMKVDREKSKEIKRILNHKRKLVEAKNDKISELARRTWVLEKEKDKMDAEVRKADKDKSYASSRIVELKKAIEAQMRRAEVAETQVSENLKAIGVLKKGKEASEAEVFKVDIEKTKEIVRILEEKKDLVAEKGRLEEEKNKTISNHVKRIEILEIEKAELEAEVCKVNKDKNNESYKIVELKKALEAQKRRAEEAIALNAKREKRKEIERILNGKKTTEDEGAKRIERGLEREKKEMETKFSQADKEKSEEIQIILNKNTTMEAEKRAMKDAYDKKNLELADRISILEKEKRGFEAEIMEKNEVIRVLYQDNMGLEDVKKELQMEINGLAARSKRDAQLFQSVQNIDNVGTLSTSWQNKGQKSAGVAGPSKHGESINHDVENSDGKSKDGMTRTNSCKRKRSIIKCEELGKKILKPAGEPLSTSTSLRSPGLVEKNSEINSTKRTNGSSGSNVVVACNWEADQDLLDAFDVDPELCLKAVCALYRQHKRLLDSANTSLSPGVFKPEYSLQAITLGEYLTTEDPECRRMKKMVGKLNKLDLKAVGVCADIAKQHYKQVFEIYKKKEDPLFLS